MGTYTYYRNYDKESYSPDRFINILKDNQQEIDSILKENIRLAEKIKEENKNNMQSVFVGFDDIKELVKGSIENLKERIEESKKESVMIIPMFTEQIGMSLTKSNFYFSLLYLTKMKELGALPDYVVMFGEEAEVPYFFTLKEHKTKKFNIILCDDGVYSGSQIKQRINNIIYMLENYIERIYICVPFFINKTIYPKEIDRELFIKADKIYNEMYESIEKTKEIIELETQRSKRSKSIVNEFYKYKLNDEHKKHNFNDNIELSNYVKKFINEDGFNSEFIEKQKIYSLVRLCLGNENYNTDKNHWFAHKIPDGYSFIAPYREEIRDDYYGEYTAIYKINWRFTETNILEEENKLLGYIDDINGYLRENIRDRLIILGKIKTRGGFTIHKSTIQEIKTRGGFTIPESSIKEIETSNQKGGYYENVYIHNKEKYILLKITI